MSRATISPRKLARQDWDSTSKWHISFPFNPINGFKSWVPCSTFNRTAWDIKSMDIDYAVAINTHVIGLASSGTISASFFDNDNFDVYRYFDTWINGDMLNYGRGMNYLKEYVRTVETARADARGEIDITTMKLDQVIPIGSYQVENTSESSPRIITVEFKIISNFSL